MKEPRKVSRARDDRGIAAVERGCGSGTSISWGIWTILFGLAVCSSPAIATPDRQVTVDEQLIGSSAAGYVVIRTETDNLGSYYRSRTKRFLDEYSKNAAAIENETAVGVKTHSRLLLDVSTSIDPEHSDPLTKPAGSELVNEKDKTLALADILERYPTNVTKWDAKRFSRLTMQQLGGVYLDSLCVVWGGTLTQTIFENRLPEAEWRLDEVLEDSNCIYLKVSKGTDGEQQTRFVCIPPRRSRQIHDHLDLKPFYLSAGSFGTKQEALEKARALIEKSKANGLVGFNPEIWTMWKPTDKIVYVIAATYLQEPSTEESFAALEGVLGLHLVPLSSKHFREKTIVRELAPASPAEPDSPAPSPPR